MPLSVELTQAVDRAFYALSAQADGHLPLPKRKGIWAALGPLLLEGNRALPGAGLQRRTRLAVLCAQHVLPVWEKARPEDKQPHEILNTIEQYLSQAVAFREAKRKRGEHRTELDDLLSEGKDLPAVYAACAAGKALATALHDETFNPNDPEENLFDKDLDPYEWDAGFYASLALAGDLPGIAHADAGKRRGFWKWYLDYAVPLAWYSVT